MGSQAAEELMHLIAWVERTLPETVLKPKKMHANSFRYWGVKSSFAILSKVF